MNSNPCLKENGERFYDIQIGWEKLKTKVCLIRLRKLSSKIHFFIYDNLDEDETETKEPKPRQNNWMEEAEKRLELLKLEVEKEDKDDNDDWDGSDFSDCSDDCDSSS